MLSYNILSQELLQDNVYLYQHCNPNVLSWDYRLPNLLSEIQKYNADVSEPSSEAPPGVSSIMSSILIGFFLEGVPKNLLSFWAVQMKFNGKLISLLDSVSSRSAGGPL